MLIDFSVENFRSFGERQTLSLVAKRSYKERNESCLKIPGTRERVLRASVIYGANASGKSNLVKAIEFARNLIVDGREPSGRINLTNFRFSKENDEALSSFEFRFVSKGETFIYGFELTTEKIVQEWLSTIRKGKEIDVFSRQDKEIVFATGRIVAAELEAAEKTIAALETLGVRSNQLLLNKIIDLDFEKRGDFLDRVAWWFTDCLTIVLPNSHFINMFGILDDDSDFRTFASEFLSSIGTGIHGIDVRKVQMPVEELPELLRNRVETLNNDEDLALGPSFSFTLDPDDSGKVIKKSLSSTHMVDDAKFRLPFHEESDGTQRFLHLLPALFQLRSGNRVFVIDEVDRSLHPLLAYQMLEFFVGSCSQSNQQLIVTTHETCLLNLDLLRRDEIWFVEKNRKQQSEVYSLLDFSVRTDLRIEKSYLQGRFGAIPFVGGMDKLRDLVDPSSESQE